MKSLFAADIRDNQAVDAMFLVAAKTHGVTKTGNSYLTLRLIDRSWRHRSAGMGACRGSQPRLR